MNIIRGGNTSSACALAFAGLIGSSLVASDAFAAPRCEAPTDRVDRIACAKAKEGPDALRRFVSRTQSIYSLYFWDYMSESDLDRHYARHQATPFEQAAGDEKPRAE